MEAQADIIVRTVWAPPAQPAASSDPEPAPTRIEELRGGGIKGTVSRLSGNLQLAIPDALVVLECKEHSIAPEPARQVCTRPDGSFEFSDVGPGPHDVRALVPGASVVHCATFLHNPESSADVHFVFGGSRVGGVVRGFDGKFLSDTEVVLELDPDDTRTRAILRTRTCADGSFLFTGLSAGGCEITLPLYTEGDPSHGWPGRRYEISLAEGDAVELQVGSRTGAVLWRGAVRGSDGLAFPRYLVLEFDQSEQTPLGSTVRTHLARLVGPELGAAELREGGDWAVKTRLGHAILQLTSEPLHVGYGFHAQDLHLPGTMIRGVVRAAATRRPVPGIDHSIRARLRRLGGAAERPVHESQVSERGTFELYACGAGDWLVELEVGLSDYAPTSTEITLTESQTSTSLDLELRRR